MADRILKQRGIQMYEDTFRALKRRAFDEEVSMYEIVEDALKAYGVNPDDNGEQKNEEDRSSE